MESFVRICSRRSSWRCFCGLSAGQRSGRTEMVDCIGADWQRTPCGWHFPCDAGRWSLRSERKSIHERQRFTANHRNAKESSHSAVESAETRKWEWTLKYLYKRQKSVRRRQQPQLLFLTVDVGDLVFLKNSLGLLDHVSMCFLLWPIKQCLLQLTLQHLQETVGVWVVMDATANSNTRHRRLVVHFRDPVAKSSATFLRAIPKGGEGFFSSQEVSA